MAAYTNNDGNQTITFDFQQEATSLSFNTLLREIMRPGIYEGGLLSGVDDSTASISPYTIIINAENDDTVAVKVETQESYNISGISATNRIIVLRFNWYPQTENYVQAVAIPSGSVTDTDIIVGTAVYSGPVLTSFASDDENFPRLQISKDADTILLGDAFSIDSNPSIGSSTGAKIPSAFVGDSTYVTEVLEDIYERLIDLSGVRDESVKARHVDFDIVDGINGADIKNKTALSYEGLSPDSIAAGTSIDSVLQQIIDLYKDLNGVNTDTVKRRHIDFGTGANQISLKDFTLGLGGSQAVDGTFSDYSYTASDTVQAALDSLSSILDEVAIYDRLLDADQLNSQMLNELPFEGEEGGEAIPRVFKIASWHE